MNPKEGWFKIHSIKYTTEPIINQSMTWPRNNCQGKHLIIFLAICPF